MNNPLGQYSLEEVLDAYVAVTTKPSREILAEWVKRFPQYANELADFTVAWIQTEHFPENREVPIDAKARNQIGVEIARRVYERRIAEDDMQTTNTLSHLDSLLKAGTEAGLSADQLKDEFNLSMVMMRKMENRFLLGETIPADLIQRMAQTLKRNTQEVLSYLNQEPMIPGGLRLKSHQSPKIGQKESFFDALRKDDSLNEDQRTYWLSFENKNK
jgi:hypothetical protein